MTHRKPFKVIESDLKTYHVIWDIELNAATPEEAAKFAREMQLDPNSIATIFLVKDITTKKKMIIDTEDEGQ